MVLVSQCFRKHGLLYIVLEYTARRSGVGYCKECVTQ
jgi:hypothetical protein